MQRCVPTLCTGAEIQPVMLCMTLNTMAAHLTTAGLSVVLFRGTESVRGIRF